MNFLRDYALDMPPRPKKRRPSFSDTYIFQLRVDFARAKPPLWRRLEIRSDATLWTVHRVIQGALDWYDGHLYRFSLGDPYAWDSELFLCDFDMSTGDDEGTHVEDVRLDETLQEPGDILEYLYDYGDSWHLKIKLEKIREAQPGDPIAVCTGGKRAAPPEDSGGMTDAEYLAEFIEDPATFELAATNERINRWLDTAAGFTPVGTFDYLSEQEQQDHALLLRFPQFKTIVESCYDETVLRDIFQRLQEVQDADASMTESLADSDELWVESLSAVQLVLDEVGEGIRLTSAGYLPPKVALRVGEALALRDFERSTGGESKMLAVMDFRAALQRVGLLRKYKGDLVLTKAGRRASNDPAQLRKHLADRLLPAEPASRDFAPEASLLTLLLAATGTEDFELSTVATWMTASGWRAGHEDVRYHQVVFQGAWQAILFWYIAPREDRKWFNTKISPVAAALARAALLTMEPASPLTHHP